MSTTSATLLAALTAGALTLPVLPATATSADAASEAAHDRMLALRAQAALEHLDPADVALLRRATRAAEVQARLRDGAVPTRAAPDRPTGDRPTPDTTTDRPVTDPAPTDRRLTDPTPTDRRSDADPYRERTFPVGDIGAVTLAWNHNGIRIVEVRAAEGWRSRVLVHEPRAVEVGFSDGESGVVFWARLTPDGLQHGVERRPADHDRDVHTYEVLDAGTVAIALTDHGMRLVGVREIEGWVSRHEAEPRRIHVVFLNREEQRRIDFVAELTRAGEIETRIEETAWADEDRADAPTDPVSTDREAVR